MEGQQKYYAILDLMFVNYKKSEQGAQADRRFAAPA
jgi:hypothetical protein